MNMVARWDEKKRFFRHLLVGHRHLLVGHRHHHAI
jgi:hypothetical protein